MKKQLQFAVCDAMQLGLILPYFIILYDVGKTAFIKFYSQLNLLISGKKKHPKTKPTKPKPTNQNQNQTSKPQQLKCMGSLEKYVGFG